MLLQKQEVASYNLRITDAVIYSVYFLVSKQTTIASHKLKHTHTFLKLMLVIKKILFILSSFYLLKPIHTAIGSFFFFWYMNLRVKVCCLVPLNSCFLSCLRRKVIEVIRFMLFFKMRQTDRHTNQPAFRY